MNEEHKYPIKDIEKALQHFTKNELALNVRISFDHLGRMLIQAGSSTVTIYDADSAKYPDLTRTDRL